MSRMIVHEVEPEIGDAEPSVLDFVSEKTDLFVVIHFPKLQQQHLFNLTDGEVVCKDTASGKMWMAEVDQLQKGDPAMWKMYKHLSTLLHHHR